jgi:tetratricopeptide (TPR) repeat protein
MKIDDCDKAISDFTEVIRRAPKNSKAYYNRGVCYKSLEKNDKAIDDFKMHKELSKGTDSRQR